MITISVRLLTMVSAMLLTLATVCSVSANQGGIVCTVEVVPAEILPFEPVQIVVTLANPNPEPQTVRAVWSLIRYVRRNDEEWTEYIPDQEPVRRPAQPQERVFGPNSVTRFLTQLDYAHPGRHVFSEPGVYSVRVLIGPFESAPAQVRVLAPDGINAVAHDTLRTSPVGKTFSAWTQRKYPPDTKAIESLLEFLERFAESRYAHLARLGLAVAWSNGVEGKVDLKTAKKLLREVSERAPEPLASRAVYHLAEIAERENQIVEARQLYQRVVATRANAYYQELAAQKLQLAQPPVENPVAAAERELAAAGYDYTDLTETQVAELRAFMFSRDDAWKEQKHDPGQEDAETARRMKQWITTNLKPKDVAFVPNPFDAMNQELADLGYDLRSLDEPTRQRFSDYVDEGLNKLTAERKVSDLEWQTEMARLMKEWALANLKPTLPPKTNDISTILAPEPAP